MKHNVMKRTLAGVMAVLTVAAYMPANVGGFLTEGNGIGIVASAEVELQEVNSAADFKTAVEAGTSVKLMAAIELTSTVNVTKDVTIDLNGYNITATDARAIFVKSGSLILTGSGVISSTTSTPEFDDKNHFESTSSVIRVGENNTTEAAALNVGSSVIVSSDWCYGVTIFGKNNGKTVDISGTVSVTGKQCAVSGNGNAGYGDTTINIHDGASISASDVAIYHPQTGILNVENASIIGKSGIEAKSGTVNISSGAHIQATGEVLAPTNNGNGTSTSGYAVVAVENNKGYAGSPTFNISGGDFTGEVGIAIDNVVADDKKGSITITGGTFDTTLDANYISNGYIQEANGNVLPQNEAEFTITQDGTIQLTEDTTYGKIKVAQGVNAVIDLNGFDLSLALSGKDANDKSHRSIIVDTGAELTIVNSGENGGVITAATQSTIENNAKFTVDTGVTLTQNSAEYTLYYKAGSTVTVKGTIANTYQKAEAAISGNHDASAGSTLNIDGGTVTTVASNAIYHPQDGTLNITGGTITGETAIYARTGNINISGGTFSSTKETYVAPDTYPNGADPTGDTLVFQSHPSYGVPAVRITGGSFTTLTGNTVASYSYNGSGMSDISITGGTFSDTLDASFIARGYKQNGNEVKKLVQQDISEYVTLSLDKNKFSYNGYEKSILPIISTSLTENTDYVVEGTFSATDVGTYVVKVRGIGDYKGEVTAAWTITNSYEVYVDYGTTYKKYSYSFGQSATVSAPKTKGDQKFAYWATDSSGVNKVSTSATYSFIVKRDVDLFPIYVENDEEVEQQAILNLTTFKSTYNGKHAVGFDFTHSVPTGCTVKEVGLLYGTNKLCGANTGVSGYALVNLKSSGSTVGVADLATALKTRSTVKRYVASYKKNNGTVRFSISLGNNDEVYANAIGYVTYVDKNNKTVTVYSDAIAASYSSIG